MYVEKQLELFFSNPDSSSLPHSSLVTNWQDFTEYGFVVIFADFMAAHG
jgi:hypothetical protein